jgi:hypothetical protein
MGVVFIKHKVKDYAKSRPLFGRHAGAQEAAGLTNPRVQSEIIGVFDSSDINSAHFAASASLKKAMEEAGVIELPTIYFLQQA